MSCCFVAGEHSWLLPESDPGVEVPVPGPDSQAHRPFLQGALPREYTTLQDPRCIDDHNLYNMFVLTVYYCRNISTA